MQFSMLIFAFGTAVPFAMAMPSNNGGGLDRSHPWRGCCKAESNCTDCIYPGNCGDKEQYCNWDWQQCCSLNLKMVATGNGVEELMAFNVMGQKVTFRNITEIQIA